MKPISNLTYLMVAYPEIQMCDADKCVDWAMEMAQIGYESPHLFMLAGTVKPTNYSESIAYLKAALKELSFAEKTGEDAEISCCIYYVKEVAAQRNVSANLRNIMHFSRGNEETNVWGLFADFSRLYWEWVELYYGNPDEQYWPGATLYNIGSIAVDKANEWIDNHKSLIELI